jgi:hypothetical protein
VQVHHAAVPCLHVNSACALNVTQDITQHKEHVKVIPVLVVNVVHGLRSVGPLYLPFLEFFFIFPKEIK